MDEITIESENDMLFNGLSKRFPDLKFYRWCNSTVDYLEFLTGNYKVEEIEKAFKELVKSVNSRIISYSFSNSRVSAMISCRCNINNSAIRIVESKNCMWKAPVSYYRGSETIVIYSPDEQHSLDVFNALSKTGPTNIIEKKPMKMEGFVKGFNISLEDLFGDLTDRQVDAILRAINSGYFEIPRKVHLENLARSMNLSKSTFQEHISIGLQRIMEQIGPLLSIYSSTTENPKNGERESKD